MPEWRPTLTSANTDRRPRRTFDMNQRAPHNDVALPQHQIGRGSQLLATASDVDDARFRVLLAKPGNGLADLGRIFQLVGAQPNGRKPPSRSLTPNSCSYFLAAAFASTPHQRDKYLQIRMMPTVPQM